jgi:hypothetical protein
MRTIRKIPLALLAVSALTLACSDGPTGPALDRAEVAGAYGLTELTFDPQGSLPLTDIRERISPQHRPTLTLTAEGQAQLSFLDPVTNLIRTVEGTFATNPGGVRVNFGSNTQYRLFLLSRVMELTFSAESGTLSFAGTSTDGVLRDRLRALVPEWQDEQLHNPTPGELSIVFTR